jgi:hypothetical protein
MYSSDDLPAAPRGAAGARQAPESSDEKLLGIRQLQRNKKDDLRKVNTIFRSAAADLDFGS